MRLVRAALSGSCKHHNAGRPCMRPDKSDADSSEQMEKNGFSTEILLLVTIVMLHRLVTPLLACLLLSITTLQAEGQVTRHISKEDLEAQMHSSRPPLPYSITCKMHVHKRMLSKYVGRKCSSRTSEETANTSQLSVRYAIVKKQLFRAADL